jgi:tetratricopeptide (TPR) repeat protein
MKKLLFSLLALVLISTIANSQEDPKKALGKASRALSAYNGNKVDNEGKLNEAKEMIEIAVTSDEVGGQCKSWQTRGDIFIAYADIDVTNMALANDPNYQFKYIDAPLKAAESYEKALSLAQKKYETKDALTGLNDAARKLNQIGNFQINNQEYAKAYVTLKKVYEVNKLLVEGGGDIVIEEKDMPNQKFVMAFCAKEAGADEDAAALFQELYEAGSAEPSVYAQYFYILEAKEDPKSLNVLEAGRSKFPDNAEILFAEINYYIKREEFKKLETILKKAIEAEPTNPSVRSALGNVYMNLFTDEYAKNGDSELAKEYFNKCLDYFNQAIDLDPKQFDAVYSIGSLYFNKAVEIIKVANDLPLSESKKYNAMTKESTDLMETALPYFKKAEALNANDTNTLIALGEIFARMNDFEKSNEFKKRLQTVKDGGTNNSSYFQN